MRPGETVLDLHPWPHRFPSAMAFWIAAVSSSIQVSHGWSQDEGGHTGDTITLGTVIFYIAEDLNANQSKLDIQQTTRLTLYVDGLGLYGDPPRRVIVCIQYGSLAAAVPNPSGAVHVDPSA